MARATACSQRSSQLSRITEAIADRPRMRGPGAGQLIHGAMEAGAQPLALPPLACPSLTSLALGGSQLPKTPVCL
eukprot:scaffold33937_cov30-Tisochrysis_lutea.AAC.7